jgi:hypothetical protein
LLCRTHGLPVRKNRIVIDGLDQTCPKDRRGNPKDYIPRGDGGLKIRLDKKTSRCIAPAGDCEKGMHAPVRRAVWIKFESRFTDRSIFLDE